MKIKYIVITMNYKKTWSGLMPVITWYYSPIIHQSHILQHIHTREPSEFQIARNPFNRDPIFPNPIEKSGHQKWDTKQCKPFASWLSSEQLKNLPSTQNDLRSSISISIPMPLTKLALNIVSQCIIGGDLARIGKWCRKAMSTRHQWCTQ